MNSVLSVYTERIKPSHIPTKALFVIQFCIQVTCLNRRTFPVILSTNQLPPMQIFKPALISLLFLTCLLFPEFTQAQTGQISGVAMDSLSGEMLPGVNVAINIDGVLTGTSTSGDGSYSIENLPAGSYDVQASYVGYLTRVYRNVQVASGQTTTLNIQLSSDLLQLDEILATAYGVVERQAVTGSVADVDLAYLESRPISSVDEAIEGQVPGVLVQNRSGIPGGGPALQVRGTGNVGAGGQPLYVIDGFALPQAGDNVLSRQNPLAEIPPEDIASITILKDASATAIYGSRASNGVIIVTTNKGQQGQFQFNVDFSTSLNTPWERDIPDPANARQFVEFQNFIWADRVAQGAATEIPAEYRDPNAYGEGTNWWDEIINTSQRHDLHLSASGGTSKLRSYFSLGYTRDEGLMVSHDFNRFSARANIDASISEDLTVGVNIAPSFSQQDLNFGGDNRGTGGGAPWRLCPIEDADEPQPGINCTGVWSDANPVNWLEDVNDDRRTLRALSSAYVNYEIIPGLTARSQINVDFRNENTSRFDPSTVGGINRPSPDVPNGNIGTDRYLNWLSETTLNWQSELGPGTINVLGGFTAQQQTIDNSLFRGVFENDAIQTFNVAQQIVATSDEQDWSLLSGLGRVNYNLNDKYIFTATIRTDGSSRFGEDNRWATFPSAAFAWNMHNESFMDGLDNVQLLRLRASYGETGNNQIGNYASLGVVNAVEYVLGGSAAPGRVLSTMGNSVLSWEKTQEVNVGVDAVLNDNVDLSVDIYQRNTTQLLINRELPDIAGFDNVTENTGELRNQGIEVGMTTYNVNRENFRWNSTVSFALNKNEVVSLPGGNDVLTTRWPARYINREGEPLSSYRGFLTDGVYTSQAQIDRTASFAGAIPGTFVYRDANGDGVLTPFSMLSNGGDFVILGDAYPDFTFSFQNSVSIGRFDVTALLTGEFGGTNLRTEWITTPRNLDGLFNVDADYVENFWRSPEDPGDGLTPIPTGGAEPRQQYRDAVHTMFLWDATHIWLRNVTLRYNLTGRLQGASIYASGSNLFVLSPYPSNPQATDLNNASQFPGRDDGNYPLPRRFTIGVNLRL